MDHHDRAFAFQQVAQRFFSVQRFLPDQIEHVILNLKGNADQPEGLVEAIQNRRIGFAWSTDGVRWNRLAADSVFAGGEAWDSKVVCDPSVLAEGNAIRVWFGGGDVASPDQNLDGQIGLATLAPVGANLSK